MNKACVLLSRTVVVTWVLQSMYDGMACWWAKTRWAQERMIFTPSIKAPWSSGLYRPAQNSIKAQAWIKISAGFLIIFLSKHVLFRLFQIAQQISAKPKVCTKAPSENQTPIQVLYCSKTLGILLAPNHVAMIPHTTLATEHWKKKDDQWFQYHYRNSR